MPDEPIRITILEGRSFEIELADGSLADDLQRELLNNKYTANTPYFPENSAMGLRHNPESGKMESISMETNAVITGTGGGLDDLTKVVSEWYDRKISQQKHI